MIEEAQQHFESGNFAAAEILYRKMLEDEPDNPEVLFMLSLARQGQDDLDESVDLLGHAIRVQPENPTLHFSLGTMQLRRQNLAEAEQAFHKAAGIDPNFVAAQNGIAMVELSRGRFPAAEHALRKALKSEPDNSQVLVNMGIAQLEQGRTDEAIAYFQQVLKLEPENVAAQVHLGRSFISADNSGFAIRCFENALKIKPDSVEILDFLADAQISSGQYADAADSYRRLVALGAESARTLSGLARALMPLGENREAHAAFLRALRLSNGQEEILLDFAELLLAQGHHQEVISRLQARVEGAEDVARMNLLLAEAKLEMGDAAGSLEWLRPQLADGAPNPGLRLLFARALKASGEVEAASAQVDRLLAMDPPPVEAVLFRAQELNAGQDTTETIDLLRGIQRRTELSHDQRQTAVSLLAAALDKDENYQAAWEQYLGLDPRVPEVLSIRSEQALKLASNEPAETAMERDVAWSWPPQPPDDGRPEPVFVFAWPGAGREDILRALSAHSELCVINDNAKTQSSRRVEVSHPQGKAPLNEMTIAEIQLARRKYWKSLRQIDNSAGFFVTVDPMWLTVEALPTLYRLFPQSHIIVLEQEPKDLATAWFQAGYQDIEAMAEQYMQQLSLLNRCREGVPLNYIDVDSRRLQDDAANVLKEVISGLSLAWQASVEEAFGDQTVTSDLAQPGCWEHYATWLQPVLEKF